MVMMVMMVMGFRRRVDFALGFLKWIATPLEVPHLVSPLRHFEIQGGWVKVRMSRRD